MNLSQLRQALDASLKLCATFGWKESDVLNPIEINCMDFKFIGCDVALIERVTIANARELNQLLHREEECRLALIQDILP